MWVVLSKPLPAQDTRGRRGYIQEELAAFFQGFRYLHAHNSWQGTSASQRLYNLNSSIVNVLGEGRKKHHIAPILCSRNTTTEGRDNLLASQENCSRAKSQIPLEGLNHSLFCAFYFVLTKKTVFPWISICSSTAGFAAWSWSIPGVGRVDEAPVSHEQTLPYCMTSTARVTFCPQRCLCWGSQAQNTLCLSKESHCFGFPTFLNTYLGCQTRLGKSNQPPPWHSLAESQLTTQKPRAWAKGAAFKHPQ